MLMTFSLINHLEDLLLLLFKILVYLQRSIELLYQKIWLVCTTIDLVIPSHSDF